MSDQLWVEGRGRENENSAMAPRFLAWAARWMVVLPTEFEVIGEELG